jgi:hypothetical protein
MIKREIFSIDEDFTKLSKDNIKDELNNYVFRDENIGYHNNQYDNRLLMYDKENNLLAKVYYVIYDGEVSISYVESVVKGKGYGKLAMIYLANEYGYENLERTSLTDVGAKMRKDLDKFYDFDYKKHKESKSNHLNPEIINQIRNNHPIVADFMRDMVEYGYEKTWEKWIDYLLKNNLINKYDFNDISEITTWIQGSVTNDNPIDYDPPQFIYDDINKLTPNNNLNEGVGEYDEITKLSDVVTELVLKIILKKIPDLINRNILPTQILSDENISELINNEYTLNIPLSGENIDISQFKLLKDYIVSGINITLMDKRSGTLGSYDDENKTIKISIPYIIFHIINRKLKKMLRYDKINNSNVVNLLYDELIKTNPSILNFNSTILHELQHNYDDFRTNGQIFNSPEEKKRLDIIDDFFKNHYNNKTYNLDKYKLHNKLSKLYYKSPHEMWARFVTAIKYTFKYNNFNDHYEFINEFIKHFHNFNILKNTSKRKLIKAAYKLYDNKINNKIISEDFQSEIKLLNQYGYELIDKKEINNYILFLVYKPNEGLYEIGITSNNRSFTTQQSQQKIPATGEGKEFSTARGFKITISNWLNKYSPIYVGSLNKNKTSKYHSILSRLGFNVGEIKYDYVDGNEVFNEVFPESWSFVISHGDLNEEFIVEARDSKNRSKARNYLRSVGYNNESQVKHLKNISTIITNFKKMF